MSKPSSASLYHDQLAALATLGLALTKAPEGVSLSPDAHLALLDLEVAFLKVQVAVMKRQLGEPS